MTAITAPPPSFADVVRTQVARLSPEVRERMARFLAAAGAGAVGLVIRELLEVHPLVSLVATLFLDLLIEPLLVDLVHTVLT